MRKHLLLLFLGVAGLMSCSKDDPDSPELNKIAKVTCYKNGGSSPEFVMDIAYNSNGEIAYIVENNANRKQFIYSGSTITVADFNQQNMTTIDYSLSGRTIVKKKVSVNNPYKKDEVYVSDEYDYGYNGGYWDRTNWLATIPKPDGTYESRQYENEQIFEWNDRNAVRFTSDKSDMVYEYGKNQVRPSSFPFRVIASFRPVDMEVFSPLNLMQGNSNQDLPTRAYWYTFPNTNDKRAEYSYTYSIIGDYVKGMVIDEKINAYDGVASEANVYNYTFEYAVK